MASLNKARALFVKAAAHDQTCREPLARLRALQTDRDTHQDGPVVWAAQNHEAARELEELESEYVE